jgi:hypothetical protein
MIAGALLVGGCKKRLKLVDAEGDPSARGAGAAATAGAAGGAAGATPLEPSDDTASASASATAAAAASGAPAAKAQPAAATGAAYPATCAGTCEKTLRCMGSYNATEQASCVASCEAGNPDPARFAKLNKLDCASLLASLKGGGGGGSSSGGGSSGGAAQPCGPSQCSTCVFDGTSCYSRVPPFLACDACCCRKGGPAPRWE